MRHRILAVQLADRVARVVGMDISPGMLAVAARRRTTTRTTNVEFVLGHMTGVDFEHGGVFAGGFFRLINGHKFAREFKMCLPGIRIIPMARR